MNYKKEINKSTMSDLAKEYELKDYWEASQEFLKLIQPIKNRIKSVYQVGSIGVPGISDLDYFIVFEDRKKDIYGKYHIMNLSKKSRYIFSHNAWFVNENVFRNLRFWFPFFNLNKVYGEDIRTKRKTNKNINLLLAIQYILNKVPSDFILYSTKDNKFRQRIMLAQINSLKHTTNLLTKGGLPIKKDWLDFIEEYEGFRNSWFELDKKHRDIQLKNFAARSIKFSLEIIKKLDDYLIKNKGISFKTKKFQLKLKNKKLSFIKYWNSEKALNSGGNTFPLSFGFYIYLWNKSKTNIGRQINKKSSNHNLEYALPLELEKDFLNHSRIIEEYNNFSKKKFKFPANGYHTLWTTYYYNSLLNFIHEYFYKSISVLYIIKNRLFNK